MNKSQTLTRTALSLFCALGIVACDKSGTSEMVGQKADDASETITQTMDEASTQLSETSELAGEFVDDATITAKVKSAILASTELRLLRVSVETVDGLVTLTGSADSKTNIEKAENLASAVEGVTGVENKLALDTTN